MQARQIKLPVSVVAVPKSLFQLNLSLVVRNVPDADTAKRPLWNFFFFRGFHYA